MARKLRLLFRRNPDRDRFVKGIRFEGYDVLWPDGQPLSLMIDSFCTHGQRLLGLGKRLAGAAERLVDMICVHLSHKEADLTRIPGHRVRRFCMERIGKNGRVYFFDGTPTTILFDLDQDEPAFLNWLGLTSLLDGEKLWFDLAAQAVEAELPEPVRLSALESRYQTDAAM
jgi:hypothetical protein